MKPVWKSLTLWSAVVALVGAVLAYFASDHSSAVGVVSDPGVQLALGGVMAALGFVGTVVGRVRAGGLAKPSLELPPEDPAKPKGQGGFAAVHLLAGLAAAVCLAGVAALAFGGCASTPVILEDDKPITLAVDSGPPCHVLGQHTDGETAIEFTAPGTCDPHVSLLWLCRRVRLVLGVGEHEPLVCRSVQR